MAQTVPIRERIKEFPTSPGVYLMKDKKGRVVYVGKAGNLRSRLRSYFSRSGDERFFVHLLDQVLGDIEVVLTRTAKEALLVENEMIKEHQPRFNVLLKDDKNFLNLRLSKKHSHPRLEVVRKRKKDQAWYFGPYASASSIRQTLRIVNRHFKLRTCSDREMKNRSRPCLEYQIQRCPAPCVFDVPEDDYARNVKNVRLFLDGRGDELANDLRTSMADAATSMQFERAAALRDQASAVVRSLEKQSVVLTQLADIDVFGVGREGPYVAVHVQEVRNGRIRRARAYKLGKNEAPDDILITQFLDRYYTAERDVPAEVLIPVGIEDVALTAAWLSERRGTRVLVRVPQRGERRRLVEGACANAESALLLDQDRQARSREVLADLQKRLRLKNFPERIECYDISNVSGTDPVASMVVFINGEPDKSEYRSFHIRSQNTPDDFLMMAETLERRFKRDWEPPDLVVIDGGKGQLGMAIRVMREQNVDGLDLISLAKSRVIKDDASADIERTPERVFLPGVKDPIILRQNSAPLYLLARLRDEAHRFAITFHKKTRRKRRLGSALDEVPGLGPSKRTLLLRHFGSLKAVLAATDVELSEVPGVGPALVAALRDTLSR